MTVENYKTISLKIPAAGGLRQRSEITSTMTLKGWKKDNIWRTKGPFLAVALLLGFFDHAVHWGAASFAAGTGRTLPIMGFPAYWNRWRFWGVVAAVAILQVAAVAGLRPLEELLRLREDTVKAVRSCTKVLSEDPA